MPVDIPAQLTTAAVALDAITTYLGRRAAWNPHEQAQYGFAPDPLVRTYAARKRLAGLLAELDRVPGPGPVVTPKGKRELIGRPLYRPDVFRVNVPQGGPYGLTVTHALAELAELATDVTAVRALAARCLWCADFHRELAQETEADRFAFEAAELVRFAAELEQHVTPISAVWLGEWRAEAAQHAPDPKTHPLVRPVHLRNR